jgi:hypothetical protein
MPETTKGQQIAAEVKIKIAEIINTTTTIKPE